jgi:hypothetical protein
LFFISRRPRFETRFIRSDFPAEAAQAEYDQAYHQNEADSAAAKDGTAKIKPAAAEQKQKDKDQ